MALLGQIIGHDGTVVQFPQFQAGITQSRSGQTVVGEIAVESGDFRCVPQPKSER